MITTTSTPQNPATTPVSRWPQLCRLSHLERALIADTHRVECQERADEATRRIEIGRMDLASVEIRLSESWAQRYARKRLERLQACESRGRRLSSRGQRTVDAERRREQAAAAGKAEIEERAARRREETAAARKQITEIERELAAIRDLFSE